MTDLELKNRGTMFIISAPSGGGKSTVLKEAMKDIDNIEHSISVTTRPIRGQEVDGVDYYFVSEEKFREMIDDNQFYEYVDSDFGPKYGTPKKQVDELLKNGKDVVFDLDYPGVQQLRKLAGERVKAIALLPPSLRVLRDRLVNRGTDSAEVVEKRMSMAEKRVKEAEFYDYVIINDDLNKAVEQLKAIILSTRVEKRNICNLGECIERIVEDK